MKKIIFIIIVLINLCIYLGCRFDEEGCDNIIESECDIFQRCNLGGSKMIEKTYAIPALEGGFMVCHTTENNEIYLLKVDKNGEEEDSPFSPLLEDGLINEITGEVGGIIQFPQDSSYMICVNQDNTIHLINIKQNGNTKTRRNLIGGDDCKCNSLTLSDYDNSAFVIGGQAKNGGNYGWDTYIVRGSLIGSTIGLEEPKPFNRKLGTDNIRYAKETQKGNIIAVGNSHELNFQSNTYFLEYLKDDNTPLINRIYTDVSNTTFDRGEYVIETDENYIISGYYDVEIGNSDIFLLIIDKMNGDIEQNGFETFSGAKQKDVVDFLYKDNNILTIGGYTNSSLYGSNGEFHPFTLLYDLNSRDEISHHLYDRANISVTTISESPSLRYIENCGYIISAVSENKKVYLIRTDENGETVKNCQ